MSLLIMTKTNGHTLVERRVEAVYGFRISGIDEWS